MLSDAQRREVSARMAVIAARHNARHRQMMAMLANLGVIDWDAYDQLKQEAAAEFAVIDGLQRQLTRDGDDGNGYYGTGYEIRVLP